MYVGELWTHFGLEFDGFIGLPQTVHFESENKNTYEKRLRFIFVGVQYVIGKLVSQTYRTNPSHFQPELCQIVLYRFYSLFDNKQIFVVVLLTRKNLSVAKIAFFECGYININLVDGVGALIQTNLLKCHSITKQIIKLNSINLANAYTYDDAFDDRYKIFFTDEAWQTIDVCEHRY